MGTTSLAKKIASIACVGAVGITSMSMLTGCSAVQEVIGGSGPIGEKIMSSKSTNSSDRNDCWGVVQDINGHEYATVVRMDPIDTNKFNEDAVSEMLNKGNVNWYQMITSDAMGTNRKEYGLLYFPASATLNDMIATINMLPGYNCHVMDRAEYEQYLADSPSDAVWDVKIYGKETTHYGPAAQSKE